MPREPLTVAARVRRMAVDEARRLVASRLATESAAAAACASAAQKMAEEAATAAHPDADDGLVEAYVAWLPVGRSALMLAEGRLHDAEAATTQARAALAAARVAAETVEKLIAQRRQERDVHVARAEQRALDENGIP